MNHPTDQTLAAFTDATLNAAERQEVLKHMVECADCREVVMWTTEIKDVEAPAVAANVVSPAFGWKRVVPLAAAAAIAVVVVLPGTRERIGFGPMRSVNSVIAPAPERPNEARLSLDVPYKQPKPRFRSGNDTEDKTVTAYKIEGAAIEAKQRAEKNPSVANLHAAAVLLMFDGKHGDAVKQLERAVRNAPSAALYNDLSAAYFGDNDFEKALENADRAWQLEPTPTAAWNRALALEFLGRYDDARAAWDKYLQMDQQSPWADEARARIDRLKGLR